MTAGAAAYRSIGIARAAPTALVPRAALPALDADAQHARNFLNIVGEHCTIALGN